MWSVVLEKVSEKKVARKWWRNEYQTNPEVKTLRGRLRFPAPDTVFYEESSARDFIEIYHHVNQPADAVFFRNCAGTICALIGGNLK